MTRTTSPTHPKPGTDNARFLDALIAASPEVFWNPNSRLELMAHSRASDLRELGWEIESVSRARENSRKRDWGYRLLNPPALNLFDGAA